MNFVCWEISRRWEAWPDVGISRLFYEIRQVELLGQIEVDFIYQNAPVTAAMLLKNIKNRLWITIVKEPATHKEKHWRINR
jgi:hypothetical protein